MTEIRPVPDREPDPSTDEASVLADLVQRSGRGDEQAFAGLYDRVAPRLYGLILRVVRDPSQSEEVMQEVMVEIWRQSTRYDVKAGSAIGWMMTIAHRRAVDRVRSAEASSRRDTSYHQTNQQVEHDSTAEAATQSMEARRVRTALKDLTDAQRGALELAYFGGYSHSEVASMLDIPLGTAKTRIRDGLIRLRDALGVSA
ncbi:ECF RNA polymerase sigma factor SigK [Alteromonas gracilis]